MGNNTKTILEFRSALRDILDYWKTKTIDPEHGGFHGQLTNDDKVVKGAIKGAVLNARILWSFSAGYGLERDASWLELAERAYNYIKKYFVDPVFDGVYWSVTADGAPADM